MPYTIHWEPRGVVERLVGTITREELENLSRDFYNDERSDSVKYKILDCTGVDAAHINCEDMRHFAAVDYGGSLSLRTLRYAVIINDARQQSLLNQYLKVSEKLGTPWVFQFFQNESEARRWVGAAP